MRSLNSVDLIGTLGRDPEVKILPSGSSVVTLSIATDESYNDKQTGQKVEKTEWHRLTAFGKLADIIGQYLKKGSKAYFKGKLRTNEYEKDGIKRYSTEIVVSDMLMLDSKPKDNTGDFQQQYQGGYPQQPSQGGFPQQYSQGGYPQQPSQGGFPQQPSQGGYPQQQYPGGFNQ